MAGEAQPEYRKGHISAASTIAAWRAVYALDRAAKRLEDYADKLRIDGEHNRAKRVNKSAVNCASAANVLREALSGKDEK